MKEHGKYHRKFQLNFIIDLFITRAIRLLWAIESLAKNSIKPESVNSNNCLFNPLRPKFFCKFSKNSIKNFESSLSPQLGLPEK